MSIEEPGNTPGQTTPASVEATRTKRSRGAWAIGGSALVGLLLVGAVAGAVGMKYGQMSEKQALLPPVAINAMTDDSLVAVKGKAVELFGNKFIITDSTGRALVDTGREGEDRTLVAKDEQVTVQGRFDNGFVRAAMVIHEDGTVDELRPARPGPGHGRGPHGHDHGPRSAGRDDAPPSRLGPSPESPEAPRG